MECNVVSGGVSVGGFGMKRHPAIHWNPGNKVVQDHRTGKIRPRLTNKERKSRGLPVPWKPEYGDAETRMPDMV